MSKWRLLSSVFQIVVGIAAIVAYVIIALIMSAVVRLFS